MPMPLTSRSELSECKGIFKVVNDKPAFNYISGLDTTGRTEGSAARISVLRWDTGSFACSLETHGTYSPRSAVPRARSPPLYWAVIAPSPEPN